MNRTSSSIVGLVLVLVLFLSVNVAGKAIPSARIDLTENGLFTLSEGARHILESLDASEPIHLRFYFSEKVADELPGPLASQYDAYAKRVRDVLHEFARIGGDGLILEEFDPEPFSETEDLAVQYGLQGLQAPTGDSLYFGLAGSNSVGDEEVIPLFQEERERFLEYDLARLVHALAHPEKPVLGLLSTLPIEGAVPNPMNPQPPDPWYVADMLRQAYEVRTILPSSGTIPEDVNLLLVVHPKNLSDPMLYAIDQFILSGGKAVILVDPRSDSEVIPPDPNNQLSSLFADRSSNLDKLFKTWGLEVTTDSVVADAKCSPYSQPVTDPQTQRQETIKNVLILLMLDYEDENGQRVSCLSPDEVATADLKLGINFNTAAALRKADDAKIDLIPLVQTSPASKLIDKQQIQFQPDLRGLIKELADQETLASTGIVTPERFTLAARIHGEVQSAFPDGPPGEAEGSQEDQEHLKQSEGPIDVIVVGDTDWLSDPMWVRELGTLGRQRLVTHFADNGNFLMNALDNMAGSTDLISLRGRGGARRPFTKVQELERLADERYKSEEDQLLARIDQAEKRISELQKEKDEGSRYILSPEQEAEIQKLLDDQVAARKRLREVRHELRKDIENLGLQIKFANIGLIPIVLTGLALGLGAARQRRRQRKGGLQ